MFGGALPADASAAQEEGIDGLGKLGDRLAAVAELVRRRERNRLRGSARRHSLTEKSSKFHLLTAAQSIAGKAAPLEGGWRRRLLGRSMADWRLAGRVVPLSQTDQPHGSNSVASSTAILGAGGETLPSESVDLPCRCLPPTAQRSLADGPHDPDEAMPTAGPSHDEVVPIVAEFGTE